jgi:two-component system NtrC family sensor kinase
MTTQFPLNNQPFWSGLRHHLSLYGSCWLLALLALWLGVYINPLLGLATAGLAALSWLTIYRLAQQQRETQQGKDRADEQLLQSQKLAAVGELAAGLAHEINNPLAIIRQEAEWLLFLCRQSDPLDMTEAITGLRQILKQVDRSREITTNLLNFARRQKPVAQAVNLNRLVEDMVRLVAKEAQQRHITIITELAPDMPLLSTDAPLLRQVVLNLLNNAMQAINRDGTITIRTQILGANQVGLTISDTGCGIPKDHLPRIFDPFFTTKPSGQGTGLGLSICHGIIDRLGGTIAVASEVGKGSTFTITLPMTLTRQEI